MLKWALLRSTQGQPALGDPATRDMFQNGRHERPYLPVSDGTVSGAALCARAWALEASVRDA